MQYAEVADAENDLVQQFFIGQFVAEPEQVAGDVTELKWHALATKGALWKKNFLYVISMYSNL